MFLPLELTSALPVPEKMRTPTLELEVAVVFVTLLLLEDDRISSAGLTEPVAMMLLMTWLLFDETSKYKPRSVDELEVALLMMLNVESRT